MCTGRCRSGGDVLLCSALTRAAWGVTGAGRCHVSPLSMCSFTVLLHDGMGLWESFLQKVTGTPDMMGTTTLPPTQWWWWGKSLWLTLKIFMPFTLEIPLLGYFYRLSTLTILVEKYLKHHESTIIGD